MIITIMMMIYYKNNNHNHTNNNDNNVLDRVSWGKMSIIEMIEGLIMIILRIMSLLILPEDFQPHRLAPESWGWVGPAWAWSGSGSSPRTPCPTQFNITILFFFTHHYHRRHRCHNELAVLNILISTISLAVCYICKYLPCINVFVLWISPAIYELIQILRTPSWDRNNRVARGRLNSTTA